MYSSFVLVFYHIDCLNPPFHPVSVANIYPHPCAARISGSRMEELDASSTEDNGFLATHLNHIKHWFLSNAQYLNFGTILLLASVSLIF